MELLRKRVRISPPPLKNNNMNDNKYNGWTNYATWRVNLEILGDIQFEDKTSADNLKEIVEDVVFSQYDGMNSLMYDYASAFISDVNYYEIANHINEEIDLQTKYDN
jgi:hypothetical protein